MLSRNPYIDLKSPKRRGIQSYKLYFAIEIKVQLYGSQGSSVGDHCVIKYYVNYEVQGSNPHGSSQQEVNEVYYDDENWI